MNKKQYMEALEKELRLLNVADVGDVLTDYEAHFTRKALDGYTEEEIANRLGTPKGIANEFLPDGGAQGSAGASGGQIMVRTMLCLSDLVALPFFLLLYAWALALPVVSLGVLALGGYIALGLTWISAIPLLPVAGGILLGLSVVLLSALLFAGVAWFFLLAGQMTRSYLRWHGSRWFARHNLSLPLMPQVTGKKRRFLRRVVLVSLIGIIVLFAASFCVMSVQAGTMGFWHQWHWFD